MSPKAEDILEKVSRRLAEVPWTTAAGISGQRHREVLREYLGMLDAAGQALPALGRLAWQVGRELRCGWDQLALIKPTVSSERLSAVDGPSSRELTVVGIA